MAKIMVVSAVCPFPPADGKAVVLSGLLSYLIERVGNHEIKWLLVSADEQAATGLRQYGIATTVFAPPRALEKIGSVIWKSFVKRSASIQEALFASKKLMQSISAEIDKERPDVLICDTIRMIRLVDRIEVRPYKVLYLDDLFSVRYSRMLEQIVGGVSLSDSLLGNFGTFVPGMLRGILKHSGRLQRWLLKFEMRLVARSELSAPSGFDVSLLVSPIEVRALREKTKGQVAEFRPWLQVSDIIPRAYGGERVFVFLGSLNIPHNEVALIEFLEKSLVGIRTHVPGARLLIIGSKPTERILFAVQKWAGDVTLTGYVHDLSEVLASCCAMIVPLTFGSGIKLKVLDGLARGVPLIITDVGKEGIPLVHGRECYIENDLANFGQWMAKVVDSSQNSKMSTACKMLFESHYGRDVVFENYDSILQSRIAMPRMSGNEPLPAMVSAISGNML